jgi:predicted anti-sigma-YlaC factor YlaD
VNNNPDCERVRLHLMAAFDAEAVGGEPDPGPDARQHLASCAACRQWLSGLESIGSRLERVSYANAPVDLWPALERALRASETRQLNRRRLYGLAGLLLGWRSLQLFVDLPLPLLHSIIPLALGLAALWQLARDPLAIQTFAPELQKRGA